MPPESDGSLEGVPFARSRALRLTAPEFARAANLPSPWPCYGGSACHCCDGSRCCEEPCTADSAHCPSGGQCWYVCSAGDGLYQCCDWHDPSGKLCVCVSFAPIPC